MLDYCASVSKGEVQAGTYLNGVYGFGDMGKARSEYTSQVVVDTLSSAFVSGTTKAAWTPVVPTSIRLLDENNNQVDDADGQHPATADASGVITQTSFKTGKTAADVKKLAYKYNNEYIPANDIPKIRPVMRNLNLTAKTRRIAVEYSNLAQFQAKNDYGYDMAAEIAAQAVAELNLEIDSEAILLLRQYAENDPRLVFSKTAPVGVSMTEHYQRFLEIIERAKRVIYDRTKKFVPNILVIASDIMEILPFVNGWKPANNSSVAGAYQAGTLNGMKVYVSPILGLGEFFVECKGNDMATAPAVYAPFMPIVPTQLLEFADGLTTRGWSTMYDMKVLSVYDVNAAGVPVDATRTGLAFKIDEAGQPSTGHPTEGQFSPLLVAGKVVA